MPLKCLNIFTVFLFLQVQFVLELIQDLIKRFAIDSEEFYQHVSPYIGRHTRHFMHEFLTFARSPYIMGVYDTKAIYQPSAQMISSSESSGDDSDVVVIDDDDAEEAGRPAHEQRGSEGAGSLRRSHGNEPPSVRQEFSSSSDQTPASSQLRMLLGGIGSANSSTNSGWDSPTPGPSWDLGATSSSPVNVVDSSDSEASTIINAVDLGLQDGAERGTADESGDGDEVIFVGYDKPWEERSPIQLSSGSDDESYSKFAKQLARNHKRRLAAASTGEDHCSQSRHRIRSRSPTPPSAYRRSRSPHERKSCGHREGSLSSTGCRHRSSSASSSHKRNDKKHRKHRPNSSEDSEVLTHSSSGGQGNGRRHHSRSRSSHKKRKRNRLEDEGQALDQPRKKKHKHKKKHKKHREKCESGQSKRYQHSHSTSTSSRRDACSIASSIEQESRREKSESEQSRRYEDSHSSRRDVCSTASSREQEIHRESSETCKKHPSGHKKSRLQDSGDGCRDGRHCTPERSQSSRKSSETDNNGQASTWSSLHLLLSTHHQSPPNHSASYFSFPSIDVSSRWENIGRASGQIDPPSSAMASQILQCENSSQEPVVITSSDESDQDYRSTEQSGEDNSGSELPVAQTVVVPCSSRLNVPTDGINFSSLADDGLRPSATMLGLTGAENNEDDVYIDVDSLSSSDKMSDTESDEILDVESVSEVEGDPQSDGRVHEVAEICAEPAEAVPLALSTNTDQATASAVSSPCPPVVEGILMKDVFMGVAHSSQLLSCQHSGASFNLALVSQDFPLSHSQEQDQTVRSEEASSALNVYRESNAGILHQSAFQSSCHKVHLCTDMSAQGRQADGPAPKPCHSRDQNKEIPESVTQSAAADSMTIGRQESAGSVTGGRQESTGSMPVQAKQSDSSGDVASSSNDEDASEDGELIIDENDSDEMESIATSSHLGGMSQSANQNVSTSSINGQADDVEEEDAGYEDDETLACHSSSAPELLSENENEEETEMAIPLLARSNPLTSEVNAQDNTDNSPMCSSSRNCNLADDHQEICDSSSDRDAPDPTERKASDDHLSANMLSSTDFDLSSSSSDELDTTESHGSLSSMVDVPASSIGITAGTNICTVSQSQMFLLAQHQAHTLATTSNVRDLELSCFESIDADSSGNNESGPSNLEDYVSASFTFQEACEVDNSENQHLARAAPVACGGERDFEADSSSSDDELGSSVSNICDAEDNSQMGEPDAVSSSGANSFEESQRYVQHGSQAGQGMEQLESMPDTGAQETGYVPFTSECQVIDADSSGNESRQWSDSSSEDDNESGVGSSGVNPDHYTSDPEETVDHASR